MTTDNQCKCSSYTLVFCLEIDFFKCENVTLIHYTSDNLLVVTCECLSRNAIAAQNDFKDCSSSEIYHANVFVVLPAYLFEAIWVFFKSSFIGLPFLILDPAGKSSTGGF